MVRLYSHGECSDLTISCNGKNYNVHRAIICPRSEFFAAACRGPFREAVERNIHLPEDDAQIIDMMVQYFYTLDYQVPLSTNIQVVDEKHNHTLQKSATSTSTAGSELITHTQVYFLAVKYLISGLKALALKKFEAAVLQHWSTGYFLSAAQEAYRFTGEKDQGIKAVIVATFFKHSNLLNKEAARDIVRGTDLLAYDILIYTHQQSKVNRWGL
ncbi:hypothetical protein AK830_g8325 [Neonectria ditissima]|uniref:BTB domain-containing protein n=1 Tax=Neonectria ditissima TaxID=78410 RepID=A0A0P7BEG2_9HYPO|nr:hypothetical protein AK830_g8325 [Neonectria ditissima]